MIISNRFKSWRVVLSIWLIILVAACNPQQNGGEDKQEISGNPLLTASVEQTNELGSLAYLNATLPVEQRVEDLLGRMTLQEKIGQMVQVSKDGVRPGDVTEYFIGSILSPGGGSPLKNNVEGWAEMVNAFQEEALATRLEIPLIYGVDAVHGHGNMFGATIFPHQIGLGAARNPELVRQIAQVTAEEMLATGIPWNYAPVVAAAQDIRWGRTYETYSEDIALVEQLSAAYIEGLQTLPENFSAASGQTIYVLATPKHYLGDGGTTWGTSTTNDYQIDQGDMLLDEAAVRELFLSPYQTAVDLGAMSVMPSYSSWNGVKIHAQEYWLTDVLKGQLGFQGFVISDYNALNQIEDDYYTAVVTGINAGVDMNMIASDFKGFITVMERAVENGDISVARIDEAVRRILTVKFKLGLFDHPFANPDLVDSVGSEEHRQLARQAVSESLVLLKNEGQVLPLDKNTPLIQVSGAKADSIGVQAGGWTITWQGSFSSLQPGTTILEAIQDTVSPGTVVAYSSNGTFDETAQFGIVVVGETPYAEGVGDDDDLRLSQTDLQLLQNARETAEHLIVIILSGRPLVITEQFQTAESWVAAWLPGTEGQGIADVLFGDHPFTGKLPFTWPRSNDQLPLNINNIAGKTGCQSPLFPFGYGLGDAGSLPIEWIDCP